MAYPFFVGGDGLLVHHALAGLARHHSWSVRSLGVTVMPQAPRPMGEVLSTLGELSIRARHARVSSPDDELSYALRDYPVRMVHPRRFDDALREEIRRADVVLCSEEDADRSVEIAASSGARVVLLVCHAGWEDQEIDAVSRLTSCVVFDSGFLFDRYRTRLRCPATVVYPPLDWARWRAPASGRRAFACLNPIEPKGGRLVRALALARPALDVILQGGWQPPDTSFDDCPNVELRPRVLSDLYTNIRRFFSDTGVLLVPSQIDDALPTVAIQALKNGIPVLGSRVGGIPEVVGTGGVLVSDFRDADAWVEVVDSLVRDRPYREHLAAAARVEGKRFSYRRSLRGLHDVLEGVLER